MPKGKVTSEKTKKQAAKLRQHGESIFDIASELGLSTGTVSRIVRHIIPKAEHQNKPREKGKVEACAGCGWPLIDIPWSKSGMGQRIHILTCDNFECGYYRNPIKTRRLEGD